MHYEIHVTVKTDNVKQFKDDCQEIGVKPIVIETQNKNEFAQQVMTSSKHTGDSYESKLNEIASRLSIKGYTIIRKKVEIMPEENKHKDFIYYESHFRLKLPKQPVDEINVLLKNFCGLFGWHYSKNLFKKSEEFNYQMITYRNSDINLYEFKLELNRMKDFLGDIGVECDKIEIEEAIYDSNELIDASWLKR
jgi:hypothetical protein